jgi:hypothetical protein
MSYKADYIAAFSRVHPNMDATIIGPNKRGLHAVALNGDKGDLRLTEREIRDATLLLKSQGPISLSNRRVDGKFKVEQKARLV